MCLTWEGAAERCLGLLGTGARRREGGWRFVGDGELGGLRADDDNEVEEEGKEEGQERAVLLVIGGVACRCAAAPVNPGAEHRRTRGGCVRSLVHDVGRVGRAGITAQAGVVSWCTTNEALLLAGSSRIRRCLAMHTRAPCQLQRASGCEACVLSFLMMLHHARRAELCCWHAFCDA